MEERLKELTAGDNGRKVLRWVDLRIGKDESIALIGSNGCGKSTLFRVVTGLLLPGGGEVKFLGESMVGQSPDSRVRMGIGYLKQTKKVFPGLTVVENLQLAGESVVAAGWVEARISELMVVFPVLAAAREKWAGLLSGGQRQSLAVAMVLMRRPRLLLLDEPVAGMAPEAGRDLLEAVEALRRKEGFPLVIVEHRLRQVQPHVNRVLVMREGRIVDDTRETERMLDADWLVQHYVNGGKA